MKQKEIIPSLLLKLTISTVFVNTEKMTIVPTFMKIEQRGIIMFILVSMASAVLLQSKESEIVSQCELESQRFTNSEGQYIDRGYHSPDEPVLSAFPVEELQENVYAREIRQRPFECISNRSNEYSKTLMEINPNYLALVMKCKREQPQPFCNPSIKYRSIDGTCNNLLHPKWGSIFSCVRRYNTPRYEGVSGFRQSFSGKPLPDPRTVSLKINEDQTRPTQDVTHLASFFGQLVAHDLTDTPTSNIGTKPIDCCSHPGINQHPQCAPIILSENDPFYSQFGYTCINFVRASICDSCKIGKRDFMDQVTSYLDLSQVYGSTDNIAENLRANDGTGKLQSRYFNGEELLSPVFNQPTCGSPNDGENCFNAGDHRVNQHTTLMSLHTLFHREHNRIADELRKLNSRWNEETLFQEARKINIAEMQAIVYKEYLPLILGPDLMARHNLWISDQDRTFYDPRVDVTMRGVFNAAAFRLHSTLKGVVSEFDCPRNKGLLRFTFSNTEPLYSGNMSSLLEGISLSAAEEYDRFVTVDMSEFMVRKQNGSYGLDIASVNIQRGRDVGLPSYTELLSFLSNGAINIQRFEQLEDYMVKQNVDALRKVYRDVRDIDSWIGLNSEKVQENMVVGPTAGEFIARQFSELKKGDRFYFENFGNFHHDQLKTLKGSSLSRVMCDNLKIQTIQENALLFPNAVNPMMLCKDIPQVNLNFWKAL